MLRQAGLTLLAVACILSILPFSRMEFGSIHWPSGMMISIVLLFVVLGFAAFDAKRLYDDKELRLAKNFIALLVFSIIISIIIVVMLWPYFMPRFIA